MLTQNAFKQAHIVRKTDRYENHSTNMNGGQEYYLINQDMNISRNDNNLQSTGRYNDQNKPKVPATNYINYLNMSSNVKQFQNEIQFIATIKKKPSVSIPVSRPFSQMNNRQYIKKVKIPNNLNQSLDVNSHQAPPQYNYSMSHQVNKSIDVPNNQNSDLSRKFGSSLPVSTNQQQSTIENFDLREEQSNDKVYRLTSFNHNFNTFGQREQSVENQRQENEIVMTNDCVYIEKEKGNQSNTNNTVGSNNNYNQYNNKINTQINQKPNPVFISNAPKNSLQIYKGLNIPINDKGEQSEEKEKGTVFFQRYLNFHSQNSPLVNNEEPTSQNKGFSSINQTTEPFQVQENLREFQYKSEPQQAQFPIQQKENFTSITNLESATVVCQQNKQSINTTESKQNSKQQKTKSQVPLSEISVENVIHDDASLLDDHLSRKTEEQKDGGGLFCVNIQQFYGSNTGYSNGSQKKSFRKKSRRKQKSFLINRKFLDPNDETSATADLESSLDSKNFQNGLKKQSQQPQIVAELEKNLYNTITKNQKRNSNLYIHNLGGGNQRQNTHNIIAEAYDACDAANFGNNEKIVFNCNNFYNSKQILQQNAFCHNLNGMNHTSTINRYQRDEEIDERDEEFMPINEKHNHSYKQIGELLDDNSQITNIYQKQTIKQESNYQSINENSLTTNTGNRLAKGIVIKRINPNNNTSYELTKETTAAIDTSDNQLTRERPGSSSGYSGKNSKGESERRIFISNPNGSSYGSNKILGNFNSEEPLCRVDTRGNQNNLTPKKQNPSEKPRPQSQMGSRSFKIEEKDQGSFSRYCEWQNSNQKNLYQSQYNEFLEKIDEALTSSQKVLEKQQHLNQQDREKDQQISSLQHYQQKFTPYMENLVRPRSAIKKGTYQRPSSNSKNRSPRISPRPSDDNNPNSFSTIKKLQIDETNRQLEELKQMSHQNLSIFQNQGSARNQDSSSAKKQGGAASNREKPVPTNFNFPRKQLNQNPSQHRSISSLSSYSTHNKGKSKRFDETTPRPKFIFVQPDEVDQNEEHGQRGNENFEESDNFQPAQNFNGNNKDYEINETIKYGNRMNHQRYFQNRETHSQQENRSKEFKIRNNHIDQEYFNEIYEDQDDIIDPRVEDNRMQRCDSRISSNIVRNPVRLTADREHVSIQFNVQSPDEIVPDSDPHQFFKKDLQNINEISGQLIQKSMKIADVKQSIDIISSHQQEVGNYIKSREQSFKQKRIKPQQNNNSSQTGHNLFIHSDSRKESRAISFDGKTLEYTPSIKYDLRSNPNK